LFISQKVGIDSVVESNSFLMKKWFSFFLIVMSLRFVATAQIPPTLEIAETNGDAALSWSVGTFLAFNLQGATNLSPPILWNNLATAFGSGTISVPMTNSQQFFRLAEVTPIFQFAIFYNLNLEIEPGSSMSIGGPVFCNQSIWAASPILFSNSVTAVGTISSNNISDPFMTSGAKTGYGNPTFIIPPITGAGELNLLTNNDPTNVEALLQLPPMPLGSTDAYSTNGLDYFANQADLIITNTSTGGTNISVYWQDDFNVPTITKVPDDYFIISNKTTHVISSTNTIAGLSSATYSNLYWGYSFLTNVSFYDYRESKTAQAIQINVTNLGVWATSSAANGGSTINNVIYTDEGHNINSIYVYNSVPLSGTTLPAVCVTNGAQLPSSSGLAVATPDPIYVMGNFNTQTNSTNSDAGLNATSYTYPAALYGDALTVLSSNWKDSYTSATAVVARVPIATTVNAAVFDGIVPSSGSNYSGGVENFLRLLEDWTSSTALTYNGSIVVMFPSQYATNIWNGSVYGVPKRQWAFDLNFTQPGGLPPFTPRVLNLVSP
jgi:hypothetical protein